MKTAFEVMFERVSQSSSEQVLEVIQVIESKQQKSKEELFVRFVAAAVLEERFPEFSEWRIQQVAQGSEVVSFGEAFTEWFYYGSSEEVILEPSEV